MYVNRMTYGTRRRGEAFPAILGDGNTVAWFDSTLNVTKDGADLVSVWGDKSGLSHDLLQATGTNQPLWRSTGVLFDGVDNFLKTAAFTLNQPENIYMVFRQVTWTLNEYIFEGNAAGGGRMFQNSTSAQLRISGGTSSSPVPGTAINTFGIVRIVFNGASGKLQVNEDLAATGDYGANNLSGFTLGSNATGGASWSNIEVKNLIIRKVDDTDANEDIIYNYLKSKYGL